MKLTALCIALLTLGFGSSYALAKGKPPKHGDTTTTAASTTGATTTTAGKKLAVCHKAGKSGRWVKITVANKAAQKAHLKRGDVLPDADGKCPAPAPKHGTTTTQTTTEASS